MAAALLNCAGAAAATGVPFAFSLSSPESQACISDRAQAVLELDGDFARERLSADPEELRAFYTSGSNH